MPFDPDDPRLTAYALGELDDAEQVEFESFLAESDEARRFIEETRAPPGSWPIASAAKRAPDWPPSSISPSRRGLHAAAQSPLRLQLPRRPLTFGRVVQLAVAAGIIGFVAALVVPAYQAAREHPLEVVQATNPPGVGPTKISHRARLRTWRGGQGERCSGRTYRRGTA